MNGKSVSQISFSELCNETLLLLRCFRRLHRPFPARGGVTMIGDALADFAIDARIARLPGGQAVDVAVVHAECRGDQHGVVNFLVGRTCFRASSTSSVVTSLPLLCTLPAIAKSAFIFSEIGVAR